MKYNVVFKGARQFEEPVTLSEATSKVKSITSDILSEIHFMGRTSTLDLTELSIVEVEESKEGIVIVPSDIGKYGAAIKNIANSKYDSEPYFVGMSYTNSNGDKSVFHTPENQELQKEISKMAKKMAERLEKDYKSLYETIDLSPPIHPDDLKGFPTIEKEPEVYADVKIESVKPNPDSSVEAKVESSIAVEKPNSTSKECECGKEKHGFMFHSQWCPKHG